MRGRRLTRSLAVKILICAGLVAGVSVAGSGAFASSRHADGPAAGKDEISILQKKLAQCKKDLAQARSAVHTADVFLTEARTGKLVFIDAGPGFYYPVSAVDVRDSMIMAFVSGRITKAELARELARLARSARVTAKILIEFGKETREQRDKIDGRCADLAKKLKAAQGGEQKPPGSEGAFPGGTATKLTLTLEGQKVTTEMKSNKQDKRVTINAKSDGVLSGSVELNGTLPPGWQVVVFHPQVTTVLLQNDDGGTFKNVKAPLPGFEGSSGVAAYICSKSSPWIKNQGCPPAAQANIDVTWTR